MGTCNVSVSRESDGHGRSVGARVPVDHTSVGLTQARPNHKFKISSRAIHVTCLEKDSFLVLRLFDVQFPINISGSNFAICDANLECLQYPTHHRIYQTGSPSYAFRTEV